MVVTTRRKYNGGRYTRKLTGGSGTPEKSGKEKKRTRKQPLRGVTGPRIGKSGSATAKPGRRIFTPNDFTQGAPATPSTISPIRRLPKPVVGSFAKGPARRGPLRRTQSEPGPSTDLKLIMNEDTFLRAISGALKVQITDLIEEIAALEGAQKQLHINIEIKRATLRGIVAYLGYLNVNPTNILAFLTAIKNVGASAAAAVPTLPSAGIGFADFNTIANHVIEILKSPANLTTAILSGSLIAVPLKHTVGRVSGGLQTTANKVNSFARRLLTKVSQLKEDITRSAKATRTKVSGQPLVVTARQAARGVTRGVDAAVGMTPGIGDVQKSMDSQYRSQRAALADTMAGKRKAAEAAKKVMGKTQTQLYTIQEQQVMRSLPPNQVNVAKELKDMGKTGVNTKLSQSKELRNAMAGAVPPLIRRISAPARLENQKRELTKKGKGPAKPPGGGGRRRRRKTRKVKKSRRGGYKYNKRKSKRRRN